MCRTDDEMSEMESAAACEHESSPSKPPCSRFYEIRVLGRLDSTWSDWFDGLEMRPCGKGETILTGNVADQAALLGILNKLSRLNVPLLSVNEVEASDGLSPSRPEGGE